jgi:hypothetical protein
MTITRILATATASLSLTVGFAAVAAQPATADTAEICTDWTNPDGTHGTNCPEPTPRPTRLKAKLLYGYS